MNPRIVFTGDQCMYYHDKKLQYPVRVEKPHPLFADRLLQQMSEETRDCSRK